VANIEAGAHDLLADDRKEAPMFAVIFVVRPRAERWDDYLSLAKQLRPKLEAIDGFIDNERFKSTRDGGRVLSLSTWRDEKAVIRWRTHGEHHDVQEKGRFEVFEDYHLRVGEITFDSRPPAGLSIVQARFDETEVGTAKLATITEVTPAEASPLRARPELLPAHLGLDGRIDGVVDQEVFESIYNPGKLTLLASWTNEQAAKSWTPVVPESAIRHRRVRIIRDYGMFERREAPQYYPEVKAGAQATRRTAAK
jgi:heme-degrading monooxygenase HmoA